MLRRIAALLAVCLFFTLTACAQRAPEPDAGQSRDTGFPVRLEPEGSPAITLQERPERIVSLSPPITEILFAVGAGKQVVAADKLSNYPKRAPRTDLNALTPDPQAIAAYDPDLVVVTADREGKLATALEKVGTKTLVLPAPTTLDGAYAQFELLGKATGHPDQGADVARRTKAEVDKVVADTPKPDKPLSYYHELDQSFYSITSATFIGQVYERFGLTNIADQGNPKALGGYPQLSAEHILRSNPDLIFLADTKCCGQNARTVAARPGWDTLKAVKQGNVIELDDDIASRWSPRLVELVRKVADAVTKAS